MKDNQQNTTRSSNAIANQVLQKKQGGKSLPSAPVRQFQHGEDEKEGAAAGDSGPSVYGRWQSAGSGGSAMAEDSKSSGAGTGDKEPSVYDQWQSPGNAGSSGSLAPDDNKFSGAGAGDKEPSVYDRWQSAGSAAVSPASSMQGASRSGEDGKDKGDLVTFDDSDSSFENPPASSRYDNNYKPFGQGKSAAGPEDAKYKDLSTMGGGMIDYDTNVQKAEPHRAPMPSTTLYAEGDEDKQRFDKKFKDGKLYGADNKPVDTQKATAAAAAGSKGDRHIYTMNAGGGISAADSRGENAKETEKAMAAKSDTQKRIHHSTFNAGADVAAAGEIGVREGQVESFSDNSGHYQPGSKQMYNMASELKDQGAGVEKINAEFVDKRSFAEKDKAVKENRYKDESVRASALEVLGWGEGKDVVEKKGDKKKVGGGEDEKDVKKEITKDEIEGNIRASHAKKDTVMAELLKTKKRVD